MRIGRSHFQQILTTTHSSASLLQRWYSSNVIRRRIISHHVLLSKQSDISYNLLPTQVTISAKNPIFITLLQRWYSSNVIGRSIISNHVHQLNKKCDNSYYLAPTQMTKNPFLVTFMQRWYSSNVIRRPIGPPTRSLRRRMRKRFIAATKPVLDESQFKRAVSKLPPRFSPEELHNVMVLEYDPLVCLELFNWASKQHRFRHNELTYHVTIKKLGAAQMYQEMDDVVNQVLGVPSIGSEVLYNSMIYYFTEARKLTRAVIIFKHMKDNKKLSCRPTIRTYNILFAALLSRGKNSYVNHMYMETIRCLFKQMVDDSIEPDIFSLNSMIKGYVLSLHVNDALRIFHQMGVVYECPPNSFSYDYLIHGLCAQARTKNARELCIQMKDKGFVPSSKSYNSVVNALALEGEVEEAVKYLWEMSDNQRSADFITYRTVIDELCRQRSVREARCLLEDLQAKDLIDERTYRRLLDEL